MKRREIKKSGKTILKQQPGDLIVAKLLQLTLLTFGTFVTVGMARYILYGPLEYGVYKTNYRAAKGEKVDGKMVFDGFKESFGESFLGGFIQSVVKSIPSILLLGTIVSLVGLVTSSLSLAEIFDIGMGHKTFGFTTGTFLFIAICDITSVVLTYAFSMTQFIMVKEPGIKGIDAVKKSGTLMRHNKFRMFRFDVSFLPWFVLSLATGGIANVWFAPYYAASKTLAFEEIYNKSPINNNNEPVK